MVMCCRCTLSFQDFSLFLSVWALNVFAFADETPQKKFRHISEDVADFVVATASYFRVGDFRFSGRTAENGFAQSAVSIDI